MNNLKILILGVVIFIFTFFIGPLLRDALYDKGERMSLSNALIFELVIMVIIDAIIYLVGLKLVKEDLIKSIFKKDNK